MDTNPKMILRLKREDMHVHVIEERYRINPYQGNGLELITGTYQIGTSKGSVEIVWQPSTGKFYETNIKSNTSVLDTLMGYVKRFGGHSESQRQVEGESYSQPDVVEVLKAVCVYYLHIPLPTQAQGQLGQGNLEQITGRESREVSGRD